MARSNLEGALVMDNIFLRGNRVGMTTVRSTGTTAVLGVNITDYVELRLTAAAGVRLPSAVTVGKGRRLTFLNASTGAFTATLKTSTGGALAVASLVQRNKTKSVISNGTLWYPEAAAST
jgi:hypothetical protein